MRAKKGESKKNVYGEVLLVINIEEEVIFLIGVRNHGSDNSLKWPQISKRDKETTSRTP